MGIRVFYKRCECKEAPLQIKWIGKALEGFVCPLCGTEYIQQGDYVSYTEPEVQAPTREEILERQNMALRSQIIATTHRNVVLEVENRGLRSEANGNELVKAGVRELLEALDELLGMVEADGEASGDLLQVAQKAAAVRVSMRDSRT